MSTNNSLRKSWIVGKNADWLRHSLIQNLRDYEEDKEEQRKLHPPKIWPLFSVIASASVSITIAMERSGHQDYYFAAIVLGLALLIYILFELFINRWINNTLNWLRNSVSNIFKSNYKTREDILASRAIEEFQTSLPSKIYLANTLIFQVEQELLHFNKLDTEDNFDKRFVSVQLGDALQLIKELVNPLKDIKAILPTATTYSVDCTNPISKDHYMTTAYLVEDMLNLAIVTSSGKSYLEYLKEDFEKLCRDFKINVIEGLEEYRD